MNFKKIILGMMAAVVCTAMSAQVAENSVGRDSYRGNRTLVNNQVYGDASKDHSVILACPENTVFSNPFTDPHISWAGFQCSDMRRSGKASCSFQSFKNCYHKVNGVQIYFILTRYDEETSWSNIHEGPMLDEEGNFKEPMAFDFGIYKNDDENLPTEVVMTKRYMVKPERTIVQSSDPMGGYSWVYTAKFDLDETISMENGWFSICAADTGEGDPGAWISLLLSSNPEYSGYVVLNNGEDILWSFSSMVFCFTGEGEMISNKSLCIDEIVYPGTYSNGKYEKITTTLVNAGSTDISDATLEVWEKDEMLFSEKVDATIPVGEDYTYTFKNRVNCSEDGTHDFTIKNVTPGDENLCPTEVYFTTIKAEEGQAVESVAENCNHYYIKHVQFGDVDNESEATTYSDFTDLSTTMHYGEELKVTVAAFEAPIITVWVDWNEDGKFDGDGEYIGSKEFKVQQTKSFVKFKVPEGQNILPGKKRLRIVSAYNWTTYSGTYPSGETEDYTIVLERNAGLAELTEGDKFISVNSNDKTAEYVIKNEGDSNLDAKLSVTHILPDTPSDLLLYQKLPEEGANGLATKMFAAPVKPLETDSETKHVLGWDNGLYSAIGLGAFKKLTYAQYFPGVMVRHIGGMKINSVDFILSEIPNGLSIVFYEGDDNNRLDGNKEVYRQDLDTSALTAHGWNRVALDTPFLISDKGLFVALEMRDLENKKYYMGIDGGGVLTGYGDLLSLDGVRWETLTINGAACNLNIRCNVVGDATPAISWISKNGEDTFSLAKGEEATFKMNVNAENNDYFYEAMLEIITNDELRSKVKVPVYLIGNELLSVESVEKDNAGAFVEIDDNEFRIVSTKSINDIALFTVDGAKVMDVNPTGNVTHIYKGALQNGVYVLRVIFSDGSMHSVKVPVM